jgi:hypothetical protein
MRVEFHPPAVPARAPLARGVATRFALLASIAGAACSSEATAPDVGLPNRTGPADVSRVTQEFRQVGGNAFVTLTGFPTPRSIEALSIAGLRPPAGCERIRPTPCTAIETFDNLRLRVVWGFVPAGGVNPLVALKFVTAIEPSADVINSVSGQRWY